VTDDIERDGRIARYRAVSDVNALAVEGGRTEKAAVTLQRPGARVTARRRT
jgi:ribosomal protein S13